jgi:hypothetical protein
LTKKADNGMTKKKEQKPEKPEKTYSARNPKRVTVFLGWPEGFEPENKHPPAPTNTAFVGASVKIDKEKTKIL